MSDKFFRRTWAQVDLDALKHNFEVLRSIVPDSAEIMGIVKADAYGHGVEMISKTLCDLGVDRFGVSSISEAEQLRSFGIKKPVLILGYTHVILQRSFLKTTLPRRFTISVMQRNCPLPPRLPVYA